MKLNFYFRQVKTKLTHTKNRYTYKRTPNRTGVRISFVYAKEPALAGLLHIACVPDRKEMANPVSEHPGLLGVIWGKSGRVPYVTTIGGL